MNDAANILDKARSHLREGRLSEAADGCDDVLVAQPDNIEAINLLGVVRLKENMAQEALALFENGLQLDPGATHLLNNAGEALMMLRRFREATRFLEQAVRLNPKYVRAQRNLGAAFAEAGEMQSALAHFTAVVEMEPGDVRNWSNLGEAARRLSRLEEAVGCFRKGLSLDPGFPAALQGLGLALRDQGLVEDAVVQLRAGVRADPSDSALQQDLLYTLNLSDRAETAEILKAHRKWGQNITRLSGQPLQITADRNPQRPLRIGYVAPTFDGPQWGPVLKPFLAAHNRHEFEVTCFATLVEAAEDAATPPKGVRRLRGLGGLTERAAAELIAADRIDVLVDLSGHMPDSRPAVFALRPAPVMLSWARYPVITGLPAIEHRLTDRVIDPEATSNPGGDTAVRLPGGAFCFAPPDDTPEPGPPPSGDGGAITFGCMTSLCHVSTQTTANWAAVLRRLPKSRLAVAAKGAEDDWSRRRFVDAFGMLGIEPDRVSIAPYEDDAARFWSGVDIGLDTQPWNSVQDTCRALWMGVPVMTMRGETPAGRVGASILIHSGFSEFVAETRGRHVEAVVALARAPDRLAELRRTLRDKVRSSPLGNGARLAGELEEVYRRLWRRWSRTGTEVAEPPGPPEIPAERRAAAVTGATAAAPKKLLLGSRHPRDNWIAVDTEAGLGIDLIPGWDDLGRYESATVGEVYAPSLLARLEQGQPVRAMLRETYRILRPGGRLRITVPDLEAVGSLFIGQSDAAEENLEALRMLFGGQADEFRWGMTWDLLRRHISEVGFRRVNRVAVFPDFPEESSRRVDGRPVTLNVEAVKTVQGRAASPHMA